LTEVLLQRLVEEEQNTADHVAQWLDFDAMLLRELLKRGIGLRVLEQELQHYSSKLLELLLSNKTQVNNILRRAWGPLPLLQMRSCSQHPGRVAEKEDR